MTDILIIAPTRAEQGPLSSVIAALPEAQVVEGPQERGDPSMVHSCLLPWFSGYFMQANPRLIILLGDRYETHAAALAAHFLRVPIAHIHGGESTQGAIDDALRHSITHMATLHLVATDDARNTVEMLIEANGHARDQVHLVGAPGLDGIVEGSAKRDQKLIVVSYYPETMFPDGGHRQLRQMIKHLDQFTPDHAIFFSRVNSDPGHELITAEIQEFINTFPESAAWISPNTREQYLHLCEHAAFAIGNSSSLVLECPWLGLPSIVVGDRQTGRPFALSVMQIDHRSRGGYGGYTMEEALARAVRIKDTGDPIYRGGAAPKIAEIVRKFVNG